MRTRSLLLLTTSALVACGGSDDPTTPGAPAGSTSNAVSVRDNSFSPSATTVTPGTTVTWTWAGSNPHNVVFDDGPSSATRSSGSYQRTFASAGSFPYHCSVHGAGMSGTVTVR